MKTILIKLYSVIFNCYLLTKKSIDYKKLTTYFSIFKGTSQNKLILNGPTLKKCKISIEGQNNIIELQKSQHWKTNIQIIGNNNHISISPNVQTNFTQIVLRGNNCKITIGSGTTFGGAYIVCMGENNFIKIGEECMFADSIEIWNSDTHPIYDLHGNITNPSAPVQIGNHVWCGKGSKILKGVTIEKNAIIGMYALVTKNIAAGTLNAGIPSHTIRENINWSRNFITK
ncbi:acyltransferase [Phocaeicola plebeius]|uniref:acyltransferase n=1 Tax=Phocaeicola plebeius TaxID=310297 RepID=UPI0026EB1CC0|nr:acyltransferase [Phocaeicola plebeius]